MKQLLHDGLLSLICINRILILFSQCFRVAARPIAYLINPVKCDVDRNSSLYFIEQLEDYFALYPGKFEPLTVAAALNKAEISTLVGAEAEGEKAGAAGLSLLD